MTRLEQEKRDTADREAKRLAALKHQQELETERAKQAELAQVYDEDRIYGLRYYQVIEGMKADPPGKARAPRPAAAR